MGIRFSGNALEYMSCGSFQQMREVLFAAAGYGDLDEMRGFGGDTSWHSLPKDEILIALMLNGDDEGSIEHAHLHPLAARLRGLVADGQFDRDIKNSLELFIELLEECAESGRDLCWG
jgi:hypothetical protein